MRALLARAGLSAGRSGAVNRRGRHRSNAMRRRLAWLLVAPALAIILLVALVPIA